MLRVFLVEDESTIREALRDTVPWNQVGYEFVGEAGDGEMALPLLRQVKPDVLLTDIRMPFMDGLELRKLVLKEFPRTKIIILSGYDDFDYARKAIDLGVERYLLKPVTKSTLTQVLTEVKEKIESETEQQNYLKRFRLEAQEYEQYTRLQFMEQVVGGALSVPQIYEQAQRLELDVRAERYALAFFSTPSDSPLREKQFSEANLRIRDALMTNFLKYPEYLLLHWRLNTYLVLIMGSADAIDNWTRRAVDLVQQVYTAESSVAEWYVAVSPVVTRLSALPGCFETLSRLWSYRHILPKQHIFTEENTAFLGSQESGGSLAALDPARMKPAILRNFLESADANEAENFVEQYLCNVGSALDSPALRQYLALSAYFCAAGFIQELGGDPAQLADGLEDRQLLSQAIAPPDAAGLPAADPAQDAAVAGQRLQPAGAQPLPAGGALSGGALHRREPLPQPGGPGDQRQRQLSVGGVQPGDGDDLHRVCDRQTDGEGKGTAAHHQQALGGGSLRRGVS